MVGKAEGPAQISHLFQKTHTLKCPNEDVTVAFLIADISRELYLIMNHTAQSHINIKHSVWLLTEPLS